MTQVKIDDVAAFEKKVVVDFWSTDLHGDKIGVFDHKRRQAQSRAFTTDLNLCGTTKDGDEEGVFGYRKDAWEPPIDPESLDYYTKRRLVIRWFRKGKGAKISLLGTIEEMVMDSLRKTMISDDPLHSFKIILQDHPYVISLTKEHARLPTRIGEMWGFSLMTDPKTEKWEIFLLDEKRITIGTDFDLKRDKVKQKLVKIDEKILNIGGKVDITFYNKALYDYKPFRKVVILFAMIFGFR
ncbi:MAG: hypothetical protein ACFFCS_11720, partial [Candidatus Hodarchaeota archaeon]